MFKRLRELLAGLFTRAVKLQDLRQIAKEHGYTVEVRGDVALVIDEVNMGYRGIVTAYELRMIGNELYCIEVK